MYFLVADHGEGLLAGNDVEKNPVAQRRIADVQAIEFRARAHTHILAAQLALGDKNADLPRRACLGRPHRIDNALLGQGVDEFARFHFTISRWRRRRQILRHRRKNHLRRIRLQSHH